MTCYVSYFVVKSDFVEFHFAPIPGPNLVSQSCTTFWQTFGATAVFDFSCLFVFVNKNIFDIGLVPNARWEGINFDLLVISYRMFWWCWSLSNLKTRQLISFASGYHLGLGSYQTHFFHLYTLKQYWKYKIFKYSTQKKSDYSLGE